MKKLLASLLVAALFAIPTAPASAQDTALFTKYLQGDTAQIALSHATQAGDIALLVGYNPKGSTTLPSGTLQTTTTTLLFKSGLAGAEAADSTVTCPSGGTAGTILLTDAACNTIGEVVDIINASSGDRWKAVNWAALRTDSTNDKFIASAASSANGKAGKAVVYDTSKTLFFGGVLSVDTPSIAPFLQNGLLQPQPSFITLNRAVLLYADVALTGTTPQFQVYSVDPKFSDAGSSEVATQVFGKTITTATVTPIEFGGVGILGKKKQKFLIRVIATTSAAAPYLYATGSVFPQ